MNHLNCARCSTLLSGGKDTFGHMGEEMCYTCHLEYQDEEYNLLSEMNAVPLQIEQQEINLAFFYDK